MLPPTVLPQLNICNNLVSATASRNEDPRKIFCGRGRGSATWTGRRLQPLHKRSTCGSFGRIHRRLRQLSDSSTAAHAILGSRLTSRGTWQPLDEGLFVGGAAGELLCTCANPHASRAPREQRWRGCPLSGALGRSVGRPVPSVAASEALRTAFLAPFGAQQKNTKHVLLIYGSI